MTPLKGVTPSLKITPLSIPPVTFLDKITPELRLRAFINDSSVIDLRHLLDLISSNVRLRDLIKENAVNRGEPITGNESFFIREKLRLVRCNNIEQKPESLWNPAPLPINEREYEPLQTTPLVNLVLGNAKTKNDLINNLEKLFHDWEGKEEELVRTLEKVFNSPYTFEQQLQEYNLVKNILL